MKRWLAWIIVVLFTCAFGFILVGVPIIVKDGVFPDWLKVLGLYGSIAAGGVSLVVVLVWAFETVFYG